MLSYGAWKRDCVEVMYDVFVLGGGDFEVYEGIVNMVNK